jgi:hypothetical protein
MTPEQIERVFGRSRLQMATGPHVEVFREAVAPGERRRYTKRFLSTREGDFGQWTEREWRILARLIGHGIACVPEVVQFDRGRVDGVHLVQTYDAGVTVDQWATLLPVKRDGRIYRHVFEDCAHWWALAHHCLQALHVIHPLELVHLDVKGDNVCIPYAPASFDPDSSDPTLQPVFGQLALIDFAFALISRERLTTPLPIGWQKDYDYQSPRLLAALEAGRSGELRLTRELDWRCDMYSLAAMLKRYLPEDSVAMQPPDVASWTAERYEAAEALILRIRDCHDRDLPAERPHEALLALCAERLHERELALSLERGWTLARDATVSAPASPLTPVTRLAPPALLPAISVMRTARRTAVTIVPGPAGAGAGVATAPGVGARRAVRFAASIALLFALGVFGAALWNLSERARPLEADVRALAEPIRLAASRVADAARGLLWPERASSPQGERKERAAGESAVSAPNSPPEAVAASSPAPARAAAAPRVESPAGGADRPPPPVARSAAGIASAPDTGVAPRAAAEASRPPQRVTTRPMASGNAATPAPSKAASAPSWSTAKPPHTAAKTKSATHLAQGQVASQPRRTHAWWASLEPPAWLHGNGPGEPGAKAREHNAAAPVVASPAPESPPSQHVAAAARAPEAPAPQSAPTPSVAMAAPVAAAPVQMPTPSVATAAPVASAPVEAAVPPAPGAQAGIATAPAGNTAAAMAQRDTDGAPAPVIAHSLEPRANPGPEHAAPDQWVAQARRTLADAVPLLAKRAEPEVARVLWMGAGAYHPLQERSVADAARFIQVASYPALLARDTAPAEARRLSDLARTLASRQNFTEAFNTALRAFGANPRDADTASGLSLLYMKLNPPDVDMARQLALFAIATRAAQLHTARVEDWYALAVASALGGRDVDAINALYVTLALYGDAERGCAAGLHALASYGQRLHRPVEALLYRVQVQGRGYDAPACAWPPNWSALSRLP